MLSERPGPYAAFREGVKLIEGRNCEEGRQLYDEEWFGIRATDAALSLRDSETKEKAIAALLRTPDVAAIPEGFRKGVVNWLYNNTVVKSNPYSGMLAMYVYLGKWRDRNHTSKMTEEEERWYDDTYKLHATVHCVVLAEEGAMLNLPESAKKSKSAPMGGGWACPDILEYWTGRGKNGDKVTHSLHNNIDKFSVVYGKAWLMKKYGKQHGYDP